MGFINNSGFINKIPIWNFDFTDVENRTVVLNNDIPWYYHYEKSTSNLARDLSLKLKSRV